MEKTSREDLARDFKEGAMGKIETEAEKREFDYSQFRGDNDFQRLCDRIVGYSIAVATQIDVFFEAKEKERRG